MAWGRCSCRLRLCRHQWASPPPPAWHTGALPLPTVPQYKEKGKKEIQQGLENKQKDLNFYLQVCKKNNKHESKPEVAVECAFILQNTYPDNR